MKEQIKYENEERFEDKKSFMRKAKVIGYIVKESAMIQLKEPGTYATAVGAGIVQGAVFKKGLSVSTLTTALTVGGMVGINVAKNIIHNIDVIKEA